MNPVPTTAAVGNLAFLTGQAMSTRVLPSRRSKCKELVDTDDEVPYLMLSSSIAEDALLEAQTVGKLDTYAKNEVDILGVEDTARTGLVSTTFNSGVRLVAILSSSLSIELLALVRDNV